MIYLSADNDLRQSQNECGKGYGEPMSSIPDQLRQLRLSKRISQDAMGARIGKSQASVSRYERGDVSFDQLEEWAASLGLCLTLVDPEHQPAHEALMDAKLVRVPADELARLIDAYRLAPEWARGMAVEMLIQAAKAPVKP